MKSILVAVDLSDVTPEVVDKAALLAGATGAKVWLLHVGPPEPDFVGQQLLRKVVEDEVPESLRAQHARLNELTREMRVRGIDADALLVQGKQVESILEEAHRLDPEFLVLGSHGRGALYRAVVGSVSEGVLRGAGFPVLIVPAPRSG